MPIGTVNSLRGLKASDRTEGEQKAINEQMGYKEQPDTLQLDFNVNVEDSLREPKPMTTQNMFTPEIARSVVYQQHLDKQYEKALKQEQQRYGINRNSINTNTEDYIDKIANEVSSHYKRYKGTDKLPLTNQDYKEIAADYDARKETYGEDRANVWLDNKFKDIVGENQSWWEQATYGVSHLIPAIEGGIIQAVGNLYGAVVDPIVRAIDEDAALPDNPDVNPVSQYLDHIIDNPITRYGRDVEHAGASNVVQGLEYLLGLSDETAADRIAATKASATRYNPEGIGEDAIITTTAQDRDLVNTSTPWIALQSGGFTALSMLTGAAEARAAGWLFNTAAKGANWLNSTGKALKTAESLEKALTNIKKASNFTDQFIIPGAVGTMEGAIEGLSTKIETERSAIQELDDFYKDKVAEEAMAIYNAAMDNYNPNAVTEVRTDMGKRLVAAPRPDYNQIFAEVWKRYEPEYIESRRQIDWAATHAGVQNFFANSLINGMLNSTFKAGLMAPRVQETLRNSKWTGWAYRRPKFMVDVDGNVTPKMSKVGSVLQVLKEPFGEGAEEYAQSLSNDVFSGAAENNIHEFITRKFDPNGSVNVGEQFGSDWAAALTALEESLVNKESIQSAILGAVSSTMGTVGGISRGYHRDEKGNLVRNSAFDPRNLKRGLNKEGEQESVMEYLRRVTPWRSGALNAFFDRRDEIAEANETAATLTEWLKDPQNKAKWDGLVGTASWMEQLEKAAESNDQFGYRKAQMGKAINDVMMLQKLKGTDLYESIITDLQKAGSGEISQEDIQKIQDNGGEEYAGKSDEEIAEKIQSNANKMLGLMSAVEQEEKSLDRMLGRVDEDTKQSLIFGKIMEKDFSERKEQLQQEIDEIKGRIQSSKGRSSVSLTDGQKALIMEYGTLNKALKAQSDYEEKVQKLEEQIKDVEAIDKKKLSDKQKEELIKKQNELKQYKKKLKALDTLRDENGQIDSSIAQLVMNEQEIMDLDATTRATVLAQGAAKLYNATHQDRQQVDQLNLEIDEINKQLDALEAQKANWITNDGRIKKGHNKQVQRNDKQIAGLQKQKDAKMRALDAEQGKMSAKPVYNSAQQEVIDNLIQQGMAQDADFLDKVVDIGRLEKAIKNYHTQYQAILSDPNAFSNYVQRAKYNAERDLTKRRAERIARIEDFKEYSQEVDRISANANPVDMMIIRQTLAAESEKQKKAAESEDQSTEVADVEQEEPATEVTGTERTVQTNYERYAENKRKQLSLIKQFAKNPNLTDNDQSLLIDAMEYLSSNGIDVTDREAAVKALIEKDEEGNQGGEFRKWVESKNSMRPTQQRTTMPIFTTIGQVVSQYVDLINGDIQDNVTKGNITLTGEQAEPNTKVLGTEQNGTGQSAEQNIGQETPQVTQPQVTGPNLFNVGYSSPDGGQFIDGEGTVATGAQLESASKAPQVTTDESPKGTNTQQLFKPVASSEVVNNLSGIETYIEGSKASDEGKQLAAQYFAELAVNGEKYDTMDDILTAVQEQANTLRQLANGQIDDNNPYAEAADILQGIYGQLNIKKTRGRRTRTLSNTPQREENPQANWISTANIPYIQKINSMAWAVQFTDEHKIDEFVADNWLDGFDDSTPVYFITNSEWTAEVTSQMIPTEEERKNNPQKKGYDTLTNMPIVVAIRASNYQNPANTTAIEVNGQWYQPIGIMPSTDSKSVSGAASTGKLRALASQEQGVHLITADGTPNGSPLTTRVFGVKGHHRDQTIGRRNNSPENNNGVFDVIVEDSSKEVWNKAWTGDRQAVLDDDDYQESRDRFIDGLTLELNFRKPGHTAIVVTPRSMKKGKDGKEEAGSQIEIFTKPMSETTDRNTGKKTLTEVLESGTDDELVHFNSRTERLFNEIIRPLFQYIPYSVIRHKGDKIDKQAHLITQENVTAKPDVNLFDEEAERLTSLLNGYDGTDQSKHIRGVRDFVWVKQASDWKFQVTCPEGQQVIGDDNTSETVYSIFFVNNDPDVPRIKVGEIRAKKGMPNADTFKAAINFMRNILWDGQQVRDFLNWQIPYSDIQNLHNPDGVIRDRARGNIRAIVDDGILDAPATTFRYDIDGVKLRSPFASEGRVAYPVETVSNPDNATPPAPQNLTPQADGAVVAADGSSIEPNSGVTVGETPLGKPAGTGKSEGLKKAEEITKRIIEDSKDFQLSEDEEYYYVLDKNTGERVKYLRVTRVTNADGTSQEDKYGAWGTPSSAVGNTVDSIVRDFFAGELKEEYPNTDKEQARKFTEQLSLLKNNFETQGIRIVPNGVVAHGKVTMTDSEGKAHDALVAGTLDLFGYDDNGNFYIFDMKTTRDHSPNKLLKEKDKWSRQISMYADLLKQTYGIEVDANNLRIIPINIDYPTPRGSKADHLDPMGPVYSEKNGQLQMEMPGGEITDFKKANPEMRGTELKTQFQPGYTPFNISWDLLSKEDKALAEGLGAAVTSEGEPQSTVHAEIEKPAKTVHPFVNYGSSMYKESGAQEAAPKAPPIIQNGEQSILPNWGDLNEKQKHFLATNDIFLIESAVDYNEMLNDVELAEEIAQEMKCRDLI